MEDEMLCGDTTYTLNQIAKKLAKENIQRGTKEFVSALGARYHPVGDGLYVERDDFDWSSVNSTTLEDAGSANATMYADLTGHGRR